MDTIELIKIIKDWGFPATVALMLLYMHFKGTKELTQKITESIQGTQQLVILATELSKDLKEQHTDIKGLRSDMRELFRAFMYGKGIYERIDIN